MVLVREKKELGTDFSGKIGRAQETLHDITKQRIKSTTPWINLNSEKIAALRGRLSLPSSSETVRRSLGGNFDLGNDDSWPPPLYKSAKEALAYATEKVGKDQESFTSRSFEEFKSKLLTDVKNSIRSKKDVIQRMKDELSAIDITKGERIKIRESQEQDRVKEVINEIGISLIAKKRELAGFISEISSSEQRDLFRKFVNDVFSLIKTTTVSSQRTDRNGVFAIPKSASYVWAYLERDNGEKHVWLRKVRSDSSEKMLLSNSTISGNGDLNWIEDCVVE